MRATVLALFVVLAIVVSASAGSANVGGFLSFDIVTENSEVKAVSAPQARMLYNGHEVRQWSEATDEYLSGLPVGDPLGKDGLVVEFWPNIDANGLAINAVYYSFHELTGKVTLDAALQPVGNCGLNKAYRDLQDQRFSICIPMNEHRKPGCVYFYALVGDGKRKDHSFFLLKWHRSVDSNQTVSKVEWTTSLWTDPAPNPCDPKEMADALEANGVGGNTTYPAAYNKNRQTTSVPGPTPGPGPTPSAASHGSNCEDKQARDAVTNVADDVQTLKAPIDDHEGRIRHLEATSAADHEYVRRIVESRKTQPASAPVAIVAAVPAVVGPAVVQPVVARGITLRNPYGVKITRQLWIKTSNVGWRRGDTLLTLQAGQWLLWEATEANTRKALWVGYKFLPVGAACPQRTEKVFNLFVDNDEVEVR